MLSELIVLENLFHWLDGLVVDVQQCLYGAYTEKSEERLSYIPLYVMNCPHEVY